MSRVVFYYTDGEEAGIDIEDIYPPVVGTRVDMLLDGAESTYTVKEIRLGIKGMWGASRYLDSDEWKLTSWYEVYLERE